MKKINIDELSDFRGTLGEFRRIVNRLIKKYGTESKIEFDAGYNNVEVLIQTEKKE